MNRADAIALAKQVGGSFDGSNWQLSCDFDDDELLAYATACYRAGLAAALSTPEGARTVEPLTDGELRAALTGLPRGWISDTVRQIALDAERAAAAKWGLVLAGGEQG